MSEDDERGRPSLAVVAQNSDGAIQIEYSSAALEKEIRALAANVMRIARGTGNPDELVEQCSAVAAICGRYRTASGRMPPSRDIAKALSAVEEPGLSGNDFEYASGLATHNMMLGALQIAASRMLGQQLQEASGHNQLMDGFYSLERLRAERRKEAKAANRYAKTARKKISRAKTTVV